MYSRIPEAVPTVLPSGTVWDFKNGRLLLGVEQLALQGIQYQFNDTPSNNRNQDLAGNACLVCLVCLVMFLICFGHSVGDKYTDGP